MPGIATTVTRMRRSTRSTFPDSGRSPVRWHAVGRIDYSLSDQGTSPSTSNTQGGRLIQAIAGLEYNGGCWVVRSVVQKIALTQDS